jgi:LA2681-like HEPN
MTPEEMDSLAESIDDAAGAKDRIALEGLTNKILGYVNGGDAKNQQMVLLHYWLSNVFSALASIEVDDESHYFERQLSSLRTAITHKEFPVTGKLEQVQIKTNLANALTNRGRYPEALEHYDGALNIIPNYGLTLANRARCLMGYARLANEVSYQQILLHAAQLSFFRAAEADILFETDEQFENLKPALRERAVGLTSMIDVASCKTAFETSTKALGRSKAERVYRLFCLEKKLFLNPINDAHKHAFVAVDSICIASIAKSVDEIDIHPPLEFSLFNRIKQEFVTARFLLYEAMTTVGVHFSDRHVSLADTYDYTLHGIAFEKLRVSFRASYSVLDRVALLVNHYWSLGHKITSISFADVWYEKRDSNVMHKSIANTNNLALRALFELSKDLHSEERISFSEPDARLLADLRNALEHRFVEITDDFTGLVGDYVDLPKSERVRIPLSLLEDRALRMLRFARNACIYLALAISVEEQTKMKSVEGLTSTGQVNDVRDRDKQRWS